MLDWAEKYMTREEIRDWLNLKDSKKGQVPIHFIRNLDFGKYLVSLGADVSITDSTGNTIVHKADSF